MGNLIAPVATKPVLINGDWVEATYVHTLLIAIFAN